MKKQVDIFIKSYRKDFWLLDYALKSIEKNVTGYNNIVLLIPTSDMEVFDTRNLPERTLVYYVPEYGDKYLYQQVCKLNAHRYCISEFILYSDSDCIFDHKVDVSEEVKDDKPQILYTSWEKVGNADIWKQPTEEMLGEPVLWEFMRRNNLIYHRDTIENIHKWKPNIDEIVMGSGRFSEFNLIGAYAFKFERDRYEFLNTDDWEYVEPMATQLWSHAGKEEGAVEVHLREYIRTLETIMKTFDIPLPVKTVV